ncbi:hypothetical protein B484DRAFT_77140 [Ochromonadaceae sp. CCMP2298]|nr:hypothetical protein B484DRAFT_77140 [Ochromonadaceae sp. CCMP2298]
MGVGVCGGKGRYHQFHLLEVLLAVLKLAASHSIVEAGSKIRERLESLSADGTNIVRVYAVEHDPDYVWSRLAFAEATSELTARSHFLNTDHVSLSEIVVSVQKLLEFSPQRHHSLYKSWKCG